MSSEVKDNKVIAQEEIVDPPSKGPLVPPSTSRSQNLAESAGLQLDSAMLKKQEESHYGQSQASSANISKEAETKEAKDKSVSETTVNASPFASSIAITLLTLVFNTEVFPYL